MDSLTVSLDAETLNLVRELRELPLEELESLGAEFLPVDALPHDYIASLDSKHKTIALRACLITHITSGYRLVPREYQLRATNGLEDGRDVLIDSGTGSGKTLCLVIPNLLHPNTTSMTISPLKRLQILQAAELERWGIHAICINEDTPNDKDLWDKIMRGGFQHLIVQPEQLKSFKGHLPRLARLLHIPQFLKSIARVHVDEAHSHFTAGLPHYGLPAFRPSWGALNELRIRLPKGVSFQALSATSPPHIKSALIEHLNFDTSSLISLKLSCNRPNIVYATHRIVGTLSDFRNLDFLISIPFTALLMVLVFHDDTQQTADATAYLEKRLPVELQNKGVIRHYHGGMSKAYLTQVFEDFSNDDGVCRILNGTEGISTGLDVAGIDAVIDYGAPREQSTGIQRGGRAGRRGQLAVYLLMAERWVYTASLDSADPDSTDPDRPISGRLLKNARKQARAGLAVVLYVRTESCLREMIGRYLADKSREALAISTAWCCDRSHPDDSTLQFDKRKFFPGRFIYEDEQGGIYAGDIDEADRVHLNPVRVKKRKAKGPPNRKVAERADLQDCLRDWLASAHAVDPLRAIRPPSFILDSKAIKSLASTHPGRMRSADEVISVLNETREWGDEWAAKIFEVIAAYDEKLTCTAANVAQPVLQHTNIGSYEQKEQGRNSKGL
ncbi:P-loop containing nucleoside triphosphate hydrolase protein [Mycena rebaudengoi]|nr:P-loop containing nucleoside triphosphate hydrolase protein [Mycena rebaudengoi]